ncbi:acetyltransferase [Pelotomaculum propionicicum]|uniref:acetyltransferase n=1 Tax=Pelotomaculum propionicicum TaxID=258475 RepID=UPI003B7DB627
MNKKLLLLGGGGHCKSVLDSLLPSGQYVEMGIIDKKENVGKSILDVPVIGCDDDLSKLYQQEFNYAFVTVGSIGNPSLRVKLFSEIERIGFKIPNIIDATAVVSQHASLENGVFIGKNAVINAGSTIGKGVIINTSATIEHDCTIEDFVHIASGAVLCGELHIGYNTHIGANSVIKQQLRIGFDSIIGMGSVVLHDIGDNIIAFGNPCKEVKKS